MFPHPTRPSIGSTNTIIWIKTLLSRGKAFVYKYSGSAKIEYDLNNEQYNMEIDDGLHFRINEKQNPIWNDVVRMGNLPELLKQFRLKEDLGNISIYIPSEFSLFYKEILKEYVLTHEDNIVKDGIHSKIAKEISSVVNDKYTELIWKGQDIVARIASDPPYYVSLDDLGSGIKKSASIMLATENINPHFILWDDFASNFHPLLIKMLLKWLSKNDWQVFITTHSIDVLYYLVDENTGISENDCRIILLNRDSKDVLNFSYKTISDIEEMINSGMDPRKMAEVIGI